MNTIIQRESQARDPCVTSHAALPTFGFMRHGLFIEISPLLRITDFFYFFKGEGWLRVATHAPYNRNNTATGKEQA